MDSRRGPVYKEWSPWPGWLLVIFWGTMLLSAAFVSVVPGEAEGGRVLGMGVLAVIAAAVQWLAAGLRVRLYHDRIVLGLGSSGWISKTVAYDEIVRTESVRYNPMAEFGGWGVRWGKEGKRAWTARGTRAVVLHLKDGTRLYVGSDNPQRLEERLRAVAGTRMGSDPGGPRG